MNMIELTGINKIYRTNEIETQALENVNLTVEKGEFLSIMGPSGCGKSTLLNIMGLLDAPTSGTIQIAGVKVEGMKDKELAAFRNRNLGFVRIHFLPNQLSGGQCQRVAIARAIVGNPEIVLADEPTGNLDSKMGAEIMELLHRLNQEDGRTVVMVTHNEEQAKQTSRIVRFFDGRQVG